MGSQAEAMERWPSRGVCVHRAVSQDGCTEQGLRLADLWIAAHQRSKQAFRKHTVKMSLSSGLQQVSMADSLKWRLLEEEGSIPS